MLNFCYDFLTKCHNFNFVSLNESNKDKTKPFKIQADCSLEKETVDEMLKKVLAVNKIESIKNYLHYSILGCKIVCIITTVAFPPASIVTIPLLLGLTVTDAVVLKSAETAVRKIKGKPVKFGEDDLAQLCYITADLLGTG